MRILIISYHFYPDLAVGAKRMSELASFLSDKGSQVTVITKSNKRNDKTDNLLLNKISKVNIIQVKELPKIFPSILKLKSRVFSQGDTIANKKKFKTNHSNHSQNAQANAREYLRGVKKFYFSMEWLFDDKKLWSFLALLKLIRLRLTKSYDIVLSSGPPMSPHISALCAKHLFRSKWVVDLRDPWVGNQSWPDHVKSGLRESIEVYTERACLEHCDSIVTASPGIKLLVDKNHKLISKTKVILNGYDEQEFILESPPKGRLSLLYTGNLYFNRNPFPLLEAFAKLVNHLDTKSELIKFILIGDCENWNGISLKEWLHENKMTNNVELHSPVKPSLLYPYLNNANVLVNFAQGQPIQIPAKIYEYIASGREMLLLTDKGSDSAKIVNESKCGTAVYSTNVSELLDELVRLYDFYVSRQAGFSINPDVMKLYSRNAQNITYRNLLHNL